MTRVETKNSAPSTPALRYNIKIRFAAMTERERLGIKEKIMKRSKISDSSYSRYINLRSNDTADIPGLVLKEFAYWLNTSIEELFNEEATGGQ